MTLELPWCPSTNTTWRKGKGRVYLSEKTKAFRKAVATIVMASKAQRPAIGPLELSVTLCPPDKRKRDMDNFAGKALLDALTLAGVWADDSQIRKMTTTWGDVTKGGMIVVEINKMGEKC